LIQHGLNQPRHCCAGGQSNDQANQGGPQAIANNERQHLIALCPERKPHADLGRALGGEVRDDSEQSYRGQYQ